MKVGIIAIPNQKGQIVIPKDIRDKLHIGVGTPLNLVVRDSSIYLYPVERVATRVAAENSYVEILKKTQGTWGKEAKAETEKHSEQKKTELQATKKAKKAW